MKNKKRKRLRNYVAVLLGVTLFIVTFLDSFVDFFMGFFTGFYEVDSEYARDNFGVISSVVGWIAILLVLVCGFMLYRQIRKKVTKPIEDLAVSMQEVSLGNLQVRVPEDGEFEFEQIQKSFNYMVDALDKASEERKMQEQKNQQLYAGIAHDLKTPMTMIMGYAKLLQSGNEIGLEKQKSYLETIIEQTEHANVLLDTLLTYSKLENRTFQLKREKRDIAECLRTCVADYYPVLEEAGIGVELQIPEKPVVFRFDEPQLKRVFLNLLSNMVKHNPERTACIVQLEETVCNEQGDDIIRIIVADNGPKIEEGLQQELFEAFAVGDLSRNTKNGSGLGLSISKKIIERHNGKISYVNEWKNGFKGFVIELMKTQNEEKQ